MRHLERRLVACLLPDHPALLPSDRSIVLMAASDFVSDQVTGAPLHIRVGVRALAVLLIVWLAVTGGLWSPASYRRTERAVLLAQRLLPPMAAVVRLYRSMALLAFYEHPVVAAALGFDDVAQRQAEFRARRQQLPALEST